MERADPGTRPLGAGDAGPAGDLVGGGAWTRADVERVLGPPLTSEDQLLTTQAGRRAARLQHGPTALPAPQWPSQSRPVSGGGGSLTSRWFSTGRRRANGLSIRYTPVGCPPTRPRPSSGSPAGRCAGGSPRASCPRSETVTAVVDAAGRWWARPEHLETIRRARRSESSANSPDPLHHAKVRRDWLPPCLCTPGVAAACRRPRPRRRRAAIRHQVEPDFRSADGHQQDVGSSVQHPLVIRARPLGGRLGTSTNAVRLRSHSIDRGQTEARGWASSSRSRG